MITVPERLGLFVENLRNLIDQYDFDLRVCSPGIIQSFNSDEMTAVVQVAIKELVQVGDEVQTIAIKPLLDVPVIVIGGGGFAITTPIVEGDECLVFFGDTCIDSWWKLGGTQEPMDVRRHDLSDGFALVGPRSLKKLIQDLSQSGIQIRNDDGTNYIELTDDRVGLVFGNNVVEVDADGAKITVGESEVEVTASGVTIKGGTVTISEKVFLLHTHSGVETGTGVTGPVV
jgi:hypothetical protein